jgi:hypothetical protein
MVGSRHFFEGAINSGLPDMTEHKARYGNKYRIRSDLKVPAGGIDQAGCCRHNSVRQGNLNCFTPAVCHWHPKAHLVHFVLFPAGS